MANEERNDGPAVHEGQAADGCAPKAAEAREHQDEEAQASAAAHGDERDGDVVKPGLYVSRRAFIAWGCALAAAVLAAGVGVASCSSNNATANGQLTGAAGRAADRLMAGASQVGRDVQARAAAGEGLVRGTVCIDAGHGGGSDLTLTPIGPGSSEMQYVEPGGTSGVSTGVEEAAVTLAVALLLRDKLRDEGVTVVMVREDDSRTYSSQERAEVANSCNADIFVRLHCDGADSAGPRGFSTLIPGYNDWTAPIVEQSAYAASVMHPIIIAETGAQDAGIVERTDLAGFNFCQVPVVLFEMGFMSNPEEDQLLCSAEYQNTLAQAICDATVAYLSDIAG